MSDPTGADRGALALASVAPRGQEGGIAALLLRFSDAANNRRPEAIAKQFTADGLFAVGPTEVRGRAAIEAFYRERQADPRRVTRHVWNNLRGHALDDGSIQVEVVLTNYAFEPAVSETQMQLRVGDVSARCVLEDGVWLFADHLYKRTFAASLPLNGPPPDRQG